MTQKTAVIAMSGGVDSSVAAALMKEQGYNVIGMMLRLWSEEGCNSNRCCTPESVEDAQLVADQLGIPFYVKDIKDTFRETVVEYFIESYEKYETPNPCLVCNKQIRFGVLMEEALKLGADILVTGHYVRLQKSKKGVQLLKGFDPKKDQSYVLYQLDQQQLQHCHFPLGEMDKTEVRAIAAKLDLPVANRPDSQDLCFIGDGDYRDFLGRHGSKTFETGNFVTLQGKVLGQHRGLPFYTIGQRKGLGISHSEPLYVVELDVANNQVVLGTSKERGKNQLFAKEVHYSLEEVPKTPLDVLIKTRYQSKEIPATLTALEGSRAQVDFLEPISDITPGQAVVFYLGDVLLGGGIIQ